MFKKDLTLKYNSIVSEYDKEIQNELAKAIDKSISLIMKKHKKKDLNVKLATTYVIKELFLNYKEFNYEKINEYIDEFIKYYDIDYQNYIDSFGIIGDQLRIDIEFYDKFINSKILKVISNE